MSTVRASDDGFCCGCCIGAALVYCLIGDAKGEEIKPAPDAATSGIEQVVDSGNKQEQGFLVRQISHYQKSVSPKLHELVGAEKICKYEPSCSEYAKQAIEKHGSAKGSLMAAGRLARCNPMSSGGYDPVK